MNTYLQLAHKEIALFTRAIIARFIEFNIVLKHLNRTLPSMIYDKRNWRLYIIAGIMRMRVVEKPRKIG